MHLLKPFSHSAFICFVGYIVLAELRQDKNDMIMKLKPGSTCPRGQDSYLTYPITCASQSQNSFTAMDFSELLPGVGSAPTHSTLTSERTHRDVRDKVDPAEETVITGENKGGDYFSVSNTSWRFNSSDSDWETTTDTSIHSSLSAINSVRDLDVSSEVLEACDGMDDESFLSTSPLSEVTRGGGKVIGRTVARNNRNGSSSSEYSESRSSSTSSSYDTTTSTYSSSSFYFTDGSSSISTSSHSSSCSSWSTYSSVSSCSCCEDSSTSFESTDDLTDLPRSKTRVRRLGKKASQRVADKCNQS